MSAAVGVTRTLTAWGRTNTSTSRVWDANDEGDILTGMRAAGARGVIARGYARSYGDTCLNDGGEVIQMTPLSSIQSFDQETGILCCNAGTSFRKIVDYCLPLGWQPAVCPGTAFVTMGGAVANDVHGKNQGGAGSFGDHLDWFDLRLPEGTVRRVTRETDPELFAATLGGIGLTGVVQAVQIRLQRVPSNAMDLKEIRVPDLDTFLELLPSSHQEYPYVVGWIDTLASGRKMGRGILELTQPSPQGQVEPSPRPLSVPFEFPAFVLNRYSVGAFNEGYFRRIPHAGRERRIHVNKFLFPLDAIQNWNRMYGRKGVFQFQCAVPPAEGKVAISALLEEIVRAKSTSFLAVLKYMDRWGQGMLSFPMPGFSLALDFPCRPGTRQLIERLQDIVLRHCGRIYLAKDACLMARQFEAMYPRAACFKAVLKRVDPHGLMQSDMSRRLNLNSR